MGSAAKSFRIVAADDSAVMRQYVEDAVSIQWRSFRMGWDRGWSCAVSPADGVECLAAVRALRPDVVVLDLEMPRMNGLEVLDVLQREQPETAGADVQRLYGARRGGDAGSFGSRRRRTM